MVAYSFKSFFAPQISTGFKCQTVRSHRRRHARPGERLQLFTGMRTRHCRKIIPDPVCIAAVPVRIGVSRSIGIIGIEVDGYELNPDEMERFARDDGFAPEHINGVAIDMYGKSALTNMSRFWLDTHQEFPFEGVLIRWGEA